MAKHRRKQAKWPYPKEATPPAIPNSPNWMHRHPTRYHFHKDVRRVYVQRHEIIQGDGTINTYVKHPEYDFDDAWTVIVGYPTPPRSGDTWGRRGRGDPVGRELGQKVVNATFNDPNPPYYDWVIWRGMIWTPENGWEPFDDDGTGLHYDHPHETFMPPARALAFMRDMDMPPIFPEAAEELMDGLDTKRETAFWDERPDDGGRWHKAEGIWVPVAA